MYDSYAEQWLNDIEKQVDISDYNRGDEVLFIAQYSVMHSAAGHFIGQVCIEYDWDFDAWIPQPWSRNTDYMHKEDAYSMLQRWEQEDPGSTIISYQEDDAS